MSSIHISDVRTFRSCRRKWSWASPLKENLEPTVPYLPFFTGKALHAALEYYYRDGIPFNETVDHYLEVEKGSMEEIGTLWPQEVEAFEEAIELIRNMIDHYALWQRQDTRKFADRNLEFVSLEQEFTIPLPVPASAGGGFHPTITLGGRFDGVVKHVPTGEYWIWETKTTRSISELTGSLVNDEQLGVYMYAASKILGFPIKGVLYNIIRKKSPTFPKQLQSGALSKAKNIDTTSFHYLACIKDYFPDFSNETITDEYGEILLTLQENDSKYFQRYPVHRSQTELDMLMMNIYFTAMEMLDPNIALYPAPSWLNCNFCQFKSPCLTMNAGGDYRVLLEEEYRVREHSVSMRPEDETQGDNT